MTLYDPPLAAEVVERLAADVLVPNSAASDREAKFPQESVAALADAGLLTLEGGPLSTTELTTIGRILGGACGSTAMIWAMHHVQVACVQRHAMDEPRLLDSLAKLRNTGGVMASVTSEVGTGGDLLRSITSCITEGATTTLTKDASTVSYGAQASAFLITARRGPDSPSSDQVAVLAERDQVVLTSKGTWDPMGMRGTCSPPFLVEAEIPSSQVLPVPFSAIAAQTMVPLSHILWSSVWLGMAEEALTRATAMVRAKRRTSTADYDRRLAAAETPLRLVRSLLRSVVAAYDDGYDSSLDPNVLIELNDLKLAASTLTVECAQHCLEIVGFPGYQEGGPFSIARILRDLYSARLMIANERLVATNSTLLLLNRHQHNV
jgi:acyl-CoA dehydrogenase